MGLFDKVFKQKNEQVQNGDAPKTDSPAGAPQKPEFENQLAGLYKQLAEQMVSMIPAQWSELHYLGEVERNRQSCSSIFYFTDKASGDTVRSHDIPKIYNVSMQTYMKLLDELSNILIAVYDCFAADGQELWEQLSMKLSNTGSFKVDFNYDVMTEDDGGQSRRELIWAHETFGYVPKEGTRSRRILDEYVQSKS